jgi:hypothetical protein
MIADCTMRFEITIISFLGSVFGAFCASELRFFLSALPGRSASSTLSFSLATSSTAYRVDIEFLQLQRPIEAGFSGSFRTCIPATSTAVSR